MAERYLPVRCRGGKRYIHGATPPGPPVRGVDELAADELPRLEVRVSEDRVDEGAPAERRGLADDPLEGTPDERATVVGHAPQVDAREGDVLKGCVEEEMFL